MVGTKEGTSRTETEVRFPTCQTHILQGLWHDIADFHFKDQKQTFLSIKSITYIER